MTCWHYRSVVERWIDGNISPTDRTLLEWHLRSCSSCEAYADSLLGQREMVRTVLGAECAPSGLWPKIAEKLESREAPRILGRWGRVRPVGKRYVAAAAIGLIVAGALILPAGVFPERGAMRADTVIDATIQDFNTFRLSERSYDLASDDGDAVRAWFAERVDFTLPPLKERVLGYRLVGGRLCWLVGQRLAAFSYENSGRVMTLYVLRADTGDKARPAIPISAGSAEHRAIAGYRSMVWRQGGFVFSLVSDASVDEMTAFAGALVDSRRQLNHGNFERST